MHDYNAPILEPFSLGVLPRIDMAAAKQPTATSLSEKLAKLTDVEVFDVDGAKVKFGSLFAEGKTIVVFIRASLHSLLSSDVFSDFFLHRKVTSFAGWASTLMSEPLGRLINSLCDFIYM